MTLDDRQACRHAGYLVSLDPLVMTCRCLICARCDEHTGNATQGHHWGWCKVTRTIRQPHFCCPGDCELEAP